MFNIYLLKRFAACGHTGSPALWAFHFPLILLLAVTSCASLADNQARLERYREELEFEAFRGIESRTGQEASLFSLIGSEAVGREERLRLYVYSDPNQDNNFYLKVRKDLENWYRFDPAVSIVDSGAQATHLLVVSYREGEDEDQAFDESIGDSPPIAAPPPAPVADSPGESGSLLDPDAADDPVVPGNLFDLEEATRSADSEEHTFDRLWQTPSESSRRLPVKAELALVLAESRNLVAETTYTRTDRIVRKTSFDPDRFRMITVTERQYGNGAWGDGGIPHTE